VKRAFILIVVAALLVLSGCSKDRNLIKGADAPVNAVPTLSPSYTVNGFDPLGAEYSGNLQVRPAATAGQYDLQWIVTGSVQQGVGRIEGNRLLVTWQTMPGSVIAATGISTYTITARGELYGERTTNSVSERGTEKAFPNPAP